MADPGYQSDVASLAEELKRAHGLDALDVALDTAREHLHATAWKHYSLWLQVVNRLNSVATQTN